MRNYFFYIAFGMLVCMLIVQSFFIYKLSQENERMENTMAQTINPVQPAMNYEEFKKLATNSFVLDNSDAELGLIHLYFSGVEKKPEFQMILNNPLPYVRLIKQLLADEGVSDIVKYITIGTMMNLELPHLADLANYANELIKNNKLNSYLLNNIIYNHFMYNEPMGDPKFLGKQKLDNHIDKQYVWQVFKNIQNNPNYPKSNRIDELVKRNK